MKRAERHTESRKNKGIKTNHLQNGSRGKYERLRRSKAPMSLPKTTHIYRTMNINRIMIIYRRTHIYGNNRKHPNFESIKGDCSLRAEWPKSMKRALIPALHMPGAMNSENIGRHLLAPASDIVTERDVLKILSSSVQQLCASIKLHWFFVIFQQRVSYVHPTCPDGKFPQIIYICPIYIYY